MANETVITGLVLDTPQLNAVSNRYQQKVALDAENLAALQAAEAALRADGKGGNTKRVIWGREGHEYCYTNSSLEAATVGSGKEVGNKVTLILVATTSGHFNVLAQVSDAAKAVQDAAKLKSLREQAAATKENKATLALLSSLGVNKNLSQLALVQKIVGTDIGAGFGAALAAMENSTKTETSRSSRLTAAKQEVVPNKKSLGGNDEADDAAAAAAAADAAADAADAESGN